MKQVRRQGNVVSLFEEFADGGYVAKLFYQHGDGSWHPPLPADVAAELGVERSRSFGVDEIERIGGTARLGGAQLRGRATTRRPSSAPPASTIKPYWQLREPEPWRLRR